MEKREKLDDWDSLSLCPHCFCATKTVIFFDYGGWEPVLPDDPKGQCGKCKAFKNGQSAD